MTSRLRVFCPATLSNLGPGFDVLGLAGPGHARAFAEVAASLCLAGEISIMGAISAGEFTRAHVRLARPSRPPER